MLLYNDRGNNDNRDDNNDDGDDENKVECNILIWWKLCNNSSYDKINYLYQINIAIKKVTVVISIY